ncbi:hypothetical protein [Gracilibacillus thailandensis]|uniref:hypothetical protein n=1 Tax=Gracilibacillus thailandensis TaxID=563735 RepID=UPI001F08FC8C|nr:hypothetical protein [Gracilibacillus thailandensis]
MIKLYCNATPSPFTFTRQRKGSKPSLESKAHPEEYPRREIVNRNEFEAENAVYKNIQNNRFF